ncbi:putative sensory histidine-kinase / response regulator [Candidatus Rickettsiella viridis]|uniref:histidine kinase n=1 Tax=Candidatus Rickettsiella viridis TaxID=676208 RepID=A0A2Z5UV73_9COXI|nr:ATP-binding protein [Candidatus Rickettsiella viridis]BBB15374.1 putative sensory histidine-kinase / response regulator [Candidatus Rickettsiella viridis]
MELVVDMNQSAAIKKNLTLTLNYAKTIYPYLIGDPDRVQRIVLELITNALKFTKKGKVALSVQLIRRSSKESIIEIAVSDTGIGIPKDQQEKIFHRFNRLVPSSKGIYKGAGLGLSIVKQFVDDLKGEIFVNSKVLWKIIIF